VVIQTNNPGTQASVALNLPQPKSQGKTSSVPSKGMCAQRLACVMRRRGAQNFRRRAQHASLTTLPQLSERRERSEQSEFCGTPEV
jgi:hypothetical protein